MTIHKLLMRTLSSEFTKICGKRTLSNINPNNKSLEFPKIGGTKTLSDINTKNIPLHKITSESVAVDDTILKIKENPVAVEWENVIKSITVKNEDVNKVLLKSLYNMKNAHVALSYYKYLSAKGETLSDLNMYLFINALSNCPKEDIIKHEDIIIKLFNECKYVIFKNELYHRGMFKMFGLFPSCFREIISLVRHHGLQNYEYLISSAFAFDDIDLVWELLDKSAQGNEDIFYSFITYCIRKVIFNEFSIDNFYKFFEMYKKKGFVLHSQNIICYLQPLITVLNHCQNDFHWSVRKCFVNSQMECLNCRNILNEITLTDEEFLTLKNEVYNTLLCGKDLFLKTTEAELNNFIHFLRNCEPYGLVIDGLNLFYRRSSSNDNSMINLIREYAVRKKKSVLVIARRHFKQFSLFKNFPKVQFFLTQNLSDDDLFVIYAAMNAGWGTVVVTSDFLNTYAAKLSPELRLLFLKWQFNHQMVTDRKFGVVAPNRHCGLPQCTVSPQSGGDSYTWHLPFENKFCSSHSYNFVFDWVCLQAIPKKNLEQKKILKSKT